MKVSVGLGSCGIAAGALEVWDAVQKVVNKDGANIEIAVTGCIGMCHLEPLLDVIEDVGHVY